MALYRLETKIIGRAPTAQSPHGQNAVACAAYRAAEKLADETTGQAFDYSHKHGVLFSGIFAPKGAPDWMRDRQTLWNRVEQSEKRIDARLAREYLLSLPHELTDAQRFQLVRDFVRENFTRHGLLADVAIHAPGKDGDQRNYHAHIMVTLRQVDGQGFSRLKYREMNSKAHLRQIRLAYGKLCNRYLRNAGHNVRVDHRAKTASQFVAAARKFGGQRDRLTAIAGSYKKRHYVPPQRGHLPQAKAGIVSVPILSPMPRSHAGQGGQQHHGRQRVVKSVSVSAGAGRKQSARAPTFRPTASWPEQMQRDHIAVMQGTMPEQTFNDKWADYLAGRVKSETAVVSEIFNRRPQCRAP